MDVFVGRWLFNASSRPLTVAASANLNMCWQCVDEPSYITSVFLISSYFDELCGVYQHDVESNLSNLDGQSHLYRLWWQKYNDGKNRRSCHTVGEDMFKQSSLHLVSSAIESCCEASYQWCSRWQFHKSTHAFSIYLWAKVNLINNMRVSKCFKDTMQWIAFDILLKWILQICP